MLVIDDFNPLSPMRFGRCPHPIISALPEGSQVAVATRVHLVCPLGRLRARGELFEFGMNDLA